MLFTLRADLTGWYVFAGDLQTTQGKVSSSRETRMSQGEDGPHIWEYAYTFQWEGQTYEGFSYKTGGNRTGRTVTIEFKEDDPQTSRIQGMGRKPLGLFGLFPILFPAVGLCFMIAGIRKGMKANRLLKNGITGTGKLISKERTNTRINKKTVYKLTFEFTADNGMTYNATAKTHIPKNSRMNRKSRYCMIR